MYKPEIIVGIIAITVSAIFSAIGLFKGYREQKRTNRINVAKRLSEVSSVLSDDLTILGRIRTELLREIKEINDAELEAKRLATLNEQVEIIQKDQLMIDEKQDMIDEMYEDLDNVKPEEIEMIMKNVYSWKVTNQSALDLLLYIKNERQNI